MNSLEFTTSLTAVANLIVSSVQDKDMLNLLATSFTQLGDTIATILAHCDICNK